MYGERMKSSETETSLNFKVSWVQLCSHGPVLPHIWARLLNIHEKLTRGDGTTRRGPESGVSVDGCVRDRRGTATDLTPLLQDQPWFLNVPERTRTYLQRHVLLTAVTDWTVSAR